jgi:GT2 family glycosyltransferase
MGVITIKPSMKEESIHPRVGIVLVNLNSYNDTSICIKSLRSITYPNVEIIVVDNGSKDDSGSQLREKYPGVTHLRSEENLGFTGGNNLGIQYGLLAGCEHILLLNNDTIVTSGFLEPLVEQLEKNWKIAAVGGKIYYAPSVRNGAKDVLWYAGSYRKWHSGFSHYGIEAKDRGQYNSAKEVPYACGCLMLMRGSVIKEIGMLSDEYFIYWEEADWCERARKAGYISYYEPKSVIYHNFKSSHLGKETPFYNYLQSRNAFIYSQKHNRGLRLLQFWSLYPVVTLYRILQDLRFKNLRGGKAILWGIYDFFRGYRGKSGLKERGLLKQ